MINRDEYIVNGLSKIKHKKWELYVISRIIHQLDSDIGFSFQQLVKTKEGEYFYADLWFSNLNIYLEVDEDHHKKTPTDDEKRKKEIKNTTNFNEKRISIYKNNSQGNKSLKQINNETDEFINILREAKKKLQEENSFKPWDWENIYSSSQYISKGYIDVRDNVVFRYVVEALKCFGFDDESYRRARKEWKNKSIWFPKLFRHEIWDNNLSDDEEKITMKLISGDDLYTFYGENDTWFNAIMNKDQEKVDKKGEKIIRPTIVFALNKNELGDKVYKFYGEFEVCLSSSNKKQIIFLKKKNRVCLS